jgi:hypothetical protein
LGNRKKRFLLRQKIKEARKNGHVIRKKLYKGSKFAFYKELRYFNDDIYFHVKRCIDDLNLNIIDYNQKSDHKLSKISFPKELNSYYDYLMFILSVKKDDVIFDLFSYTNVYFDSWIHDKYEEFKKGDRKYYFIHCGLETIELYYMDAITRSKHRVYWFMPKINISDDYSDFYISTSVRNLDGYNLNYSAKKRKFKSLTFAKSNFEMYCLEAAAKYAKLNLLDKNGCITEETIKFNKGKIPHIIMWRPKGSSYER